LYLHTLHSKSKLFGALFRVYFSPTNCCHKSLLRKLNDVSNFVLNLFVNAKQQISLPTAGPNILTVFPVSLRRLPKCVISSWRWICKTCSVTNVYLRLSSSSDLTESSLVWLGTRTYFWCYLFIILPKTLH